MDALLSVEEVAAQLSVPVATLRYWRHRGTGPKSMKVGRHVRYRPTEVERWLDEQATAAA